MADELTRYALPGSDRDDEGNARYWIELPAEWLVAHDEKVQEAIAYAEDNGIKSDAVRTFIASLEILHDWRLPGLEGKREAWDVSALTAEMLAWVNFHGYGSLARAKQVKKNWFSPYAIGVEEQSEAKAAGDSETTE